MPPSNKQRYNRVAKNLVSAAPFIEQNGQVKFCLNWSIMQYTVSTYILLDTES